MNLDPILHDLAAGRIDAHHIPAGRHTVTAPPVIRRGDFVLSAHPGAVIDATAMPKPSGYGAAINVEGDIERQVAYVAKDAARGDTRLALRPGHMIAPGPAVIRSLWELHDTDRKNPKGEYIDFKGHHIDIAAVEGDTAILRSGLRDDFAVGGGFVVLDELEPWGGVRLEGLTVEMGGVAQMASAVRLAYCAGAVVEDVSPRDAAGEGGGVMAHMCIDTRIRGGVAERCINSRNGYGYRSVGSHGTRIRGVQGVDGWHVVDAGGDGGATPNDTDFVVGGVTGLRMKAHAFTTHASCYNAVGMGIRSLGGGGAASSRCDEVDLGLVHCQGIEPILPGGSSTAVMLALGKRVSLKDAQLDCTSPPGVANVVAVYVTGPIDRLELVDVRTSGHVGHGVYFGGAGVKEAVLRGVTIDCRRMAPGVEPIRMQALPGVYRAEVEVRA